MPNNCSSRWLIQDYNSGSYLSAILEGGNTLKWCRQQHKAIYYYSKADAQDDIHLLGINAVPVIIL